MLVELKLNDMIMIWMGLCSEWQTAVLFASPCIISQWSYGEKTLCSGNPAQTEEIVGRRDETSLALSVLKACQLRGCCVQALAPPGKRGGLTETWSSVQPLCCSIYFLYLFSVPFFQSKAILQQERPCLALLDDQPTTGWAACPCVTGSP